MLVPLHDLLIPTENGLAAARMSCCGFMQDGSPFREMPRCAISASVGGVHNDSASTFDGAGTGCGCNPLGSATGATGSLGAAGSLLPWRRGGES